MDFNVWIRPAGDNSWRWTNATPSGGVQSTSNPKRLAWNDAKKLCDYLNKIGAGYQARIREVLSDGSPGNYSDPCPQCGEYHHG